MGLVQALVVSFPTAPAVRDLLTEQALLIAIVLPDNDPKLRCEMLVHDQLDIGGFVQQHPTTPRPSDQLALTLDQQGQHATTTRAAADIRGVKFLSP